MKRCVIRDCGKPSSARGLCSTHLKRWQRHGHTEDTRPQDWGDRHKHPMYERWLEIRKRAYVCPEWKDFWLFVDDVGNPPTYDHTLVRKDTDLPYDKNNTMWRPPKFSRQMVDRREYFREWRKKDPDYWNNLNKSSVKGKPLYSKDRHLRKKYGITLEQYKTMLDGQNGVCAICGQEETVKQAGRVRSLHVDHDHITNTVRGLLCDGCNRGLGQLGDSVKNLEAAIAYLKRHSSGG